MENFLLKMQSELKTIIQNQEHDAKQRAEHNVNLYYDKKERFETFDLKSKKKFYKKSLKKINEEINALDIEYEVWQSIDENTGEIKNSGVLFPWSTKKTKKVLEKYSYLAEYDYSQFKNHFMVEFEPINTLMVKLRERQFILNQLKELPEAKPATSQKNKQSDENKEEYKKTIQTIHLQTFEGLFSTPEIAQDCVGVLKSVEPPIIDQHCNYRLGLRQKGAITAWVEVLRTKGFMTQLNDKLTASLLNNKFPKLNLGSEGRTLRNIKTTAYNRYRTQFLAALSN